MFAMIELKTYNTFNSPEIQVTWQDDQFLLTKIATIAYRILIENVWICVQNQTAKVRNYFNADAPSQPVKAKPPAPIPVPNYSYMFSKTVQGALIGTLFWRTAKNLLSYVISERFLGMPVPLREKVAHCGTRASFQWINSIKQLEIKHFALASAAIPFAINLYDGIQKEPKNLPLTSKVTNAVKKQFSAPHFIFYASMIGLALANPLYGRVLGFSSDDGFDASGHLMLKTVLAPIVGVALTQTAIARPAFSALFAMTYTISDGIFLKNTTNYCHTALESLAGYAWGIGIGFASAAIENTYIHLNPPKAVKTA